MTPMLDYWLTHRWTVGLTAAGVAVMTVLVVGGVIFWLLALVSGWELPDLRAGLGFLVVVTLVTGAFMVYHYRMAVGRRTKETHRAGQLAAAVLYLLVTAVTAGFTAVSYWERFHTYQGIYEAAFDECMAEQGGPWNVYAEWSTCPVEARAAAEAWQRKRSERQPEAPPGLN